MKKLFLTFVVYILILQGYAIVVETGNLHDFILGVEPDAAYSNWASHIVEGIASEGYNMYAPYDRQTEGFGQFTLPNETQTNIWEQAVDYFIDGQYHDAHNLFVDNDFPYSVVKFTDGSIVYYMLRESLNLDYIDDNGTTATYDDEVGSFDLGWGLFICRETNPNPVVVTAPHPNDDFISPYLSVASFEDLHGQYLMINGSGREVMWTEYGNYTNGKSISDPTRNHNHPFNYFYAKACDKVREDFDRRELSVQLHSYDWDSHPGRASNQISPGQYRRPAGLPIRDFSPLKQDIIQNTDYVVIPQGTIGNNDEVTVRDYYSVHNYYYPTTYHDSLEISNAVDLPGYSNSFHDIYSNYNFSDWDVFSPFFHVEFDELPNCFPQSSESFKEFYGFNFYTNTWNFSQRYSKLSAYYQPFVAALAQAVEDWVELNDDELPLPPTNVRRYYGSPGNAIAWDFQPTYDFYTYEILYSVNPISQNNYSVLNRDQEEKLGFPLINNSIIPNLDLNQTYHIAMRTIDYNGYISDISEEIVYTTLPITTTEFDIYANNTTIEFNWTMNQQQNCLGFEIYRKVDDSEFELYSSYTNNSDLEITTSYTQNFNFTDTNVESGVNYAYKVNVVTSNEQSSQISQVMNASLAEYLTLTATGNYWDNSITFGKSYWATDSYDETYDLQNTISNTYLAFKSGNQELQRNILADFDPTETVKFLDLVIDNPPSTLTFSLDNSRYSERFYLLYNDQLFSLNSQNVEVNFPGNDSYDAKLIWGNLQAQVTFPDLANAMLYQGDSCELTWNLDYPELVESIDLYFKGDQNQILIAENLPANQTSYSFTNESNSDYRMMNLMVVTHSIDDQILEHLSYSRFVLVSEIQTMELPAETSNILFAYPFPTELDVSPIIENVQAFALVDDQYNSSQILNNNEGFFLNIMEDAVLNFDGNPNLEDIQYQISQGWNLIYNPHPVDYPLKDILFEINGLVKSFKSILNSEMILPSIVGIRNGSYATIDTLKAFESK